MAGLRALPLTGSRVAWRLLALTALCATAGACVVALAGRPDAYAGSLVQGQLVRAILQPSWPPHGEIHAAYRSSPLHQSVAIVSFPRAPQWRPAEGGAMVVFRVVGTSSFHTPDDASGKHEWLAVYESEMVKVELAEEEAIAAARNCLATRAAPTAYDLEQPFAFGPGPAGGWSVRFESEAGEAAPASLTVHLDPRGRCR